MNSLLILLSVLLITQGCGKLEHHITSDPITVNPVEVKHVVVLDTSLLYESFQQDCKSIVVDPTDTQAVNSCADTKLNEFVAKYTHSI